MKLTFFSKIKAQEEFEAFISKWIQKESSTHELQIESFKIDESKVAFSQKEDKRQMS